MLQLIQDAIKFPDLIHVAPGIDVTNDPLLQGRLFSYLDTQLSRLGSPNFSELPINRSLAPVHNNQRDAQMRSTINKGKASYYRNSVGGGCSMTAPQSAGGYVSYPAPVEGPKVRARTDAFRDYFSQATLFWKSLSAPEQDHLVAACRFELGRVGSTVIRQCMLGLFAHVDATLGQRVAAGIGVAVPSCCGGRGDWPLVGHAHWGRWRATRGGPQPAHGGLGDV